MERTMIKISADGEFVSLRTYSRKYGRSGQFVLWRKEEVLKIEITWLNSSGNELIGRLERLSLIYQDFLCCVEESSLSGRMTYRRLSISECHRPAIEFSSCRNLKKVAQRKAIHRKLGKFLDRHFQRPDAVRIQVVNDSCVPYSFFFREERISGAGGCGGIILHGQEDLKKACPGIINNTEQLKRKSSRSWKCSLPFF